MNNNLVSMSEKQNQLATGKRISKPSDDPVGITRIIKVKSDIVENEQYKENTRDAKSWLEVSESSLTDVKSILQRVRELTVQAANGTNTQQETDKISKEIEQLTKQVIVNANSTIAGRYLFSGFKTDTKLMNDDGTYNIDITSEKITDFESIAYEIAVGESVQVGTNYINVFGVVKKDDLVNDTFVFGNVANGESRVGNSTGDASTHSKIQGKVNYNQDFSGKTLEIKVGTTTYTVDSSTIDANEDEKISKEEFMKGVLGAKQTNPVPSMPVPLLGDVVDVYFVKGNDPENEIGEFVIEAKAFGSLNIEVATDSGNVFLDNPALTVGTAATAPVNAQIEGAVDYGLDLSAETLSFDIGGIVYTVDTSTIDGTGTLTQAGYETLIKDATNPLGGKLSDVMDVTFAPGGGTVGTLTLVAKEAKTQTVSAVYTGSGFTAPPTETAGVTEVVATSSVIEGTFDFSKDLTSGALSFTINDPLAPGTPRVFTVDALQLDGDIAEVDFVNLIKDAPQTSPVVVPAPTLGSVASVSFQANDDPSGTVGKLTIEANDKGALPVNVTDTGGGFVSNPVTTDGVEADDVVIKGIENINDSMFNGSEKVQGTQSFVVTYNDTHERIDIDMSSISSTAELKDAINQELKEKFGQSGAPLENNVSVDIVADGGKNVVQFTGKTFNDGSKSTLKIDVIQSDKPQMVQDLQDFIHALETDDKDGIDIFLGKVDDHLDNVLMTIADIGAKDNRLKFVENRIDSNNLSMTSILSKVQDINYSETILKFKSLEAIYRASLSTGAKVIQPTLVDFIK